MAMQSVPGHGYGCDGVNVYARVRYVTPIEIAHANCRSTVRASEIEGSWPSIVALESGSASGDGHARDCGRVSWQMLAEHRMKPFSAQQRVWSSFEARTTISNPRMCIVTALRSQSLFFPPS